MLQHPHLSKTIVSADSLELSPECIEFFAAETDSLLEDSNARPKREMQLKMMYQFNTLASVTEDVLIRLKATGYGGIEVMSAGTERCEWVAMLLDKFDMDLIIGMATFGDTVEDHLSSFHDQLLAVRHLNPILVNSLSGVDRWGMDEKIEFMAAALKIEEKIGLKVGHGLHRGRITYNPWDTQDLLLTFPHMKVCCDFSQWVAVCGRLLISEMEIIQLTAGRCVHIHTRICNEEGWVAPNEESVLYKYHLQLYEKWWTLIWEKQLQSGFEISTMSNDDPTLLEHKTFLPGDTLFSSWMNKRQPERFHKFRVRGKKM